jgi:hypothetical protein
MPYVFRVGKDDATKKALFNSWFNPGPKHRKMPEGIILEKLSSTMLLFSDELEGLRLMGYYMQKEPGRYKLYRVEEVSLKELSRHIWELISEDEVTEAPLGARPWG